MSALALDTGALIAVERGDRRVVHLSEEARSRGIELRVVAGVLAQAWRGGPQQARLARLLRAAEVDVPALDATIARAVGELCGRSGQADVVDVPSSSTPASPARTWSPPTPTTCATSMRRCRWSRSEGDAAADVVGCCATLGRPITRRNDKLQFIDSVGSRYIAARLSDIRAASWDARAMAAAVLR